MVLAWALVFGLLMAPKEEGFGACEGMCVSMGER